MSAPYHRPPGVIVTHHATARYRERFPEAREWPDDRLMGVMTREVMSALDQHRRSTTVPNWIRYVSGRKQPGVRYVWNPDQTRCYVIRRDRGDRDNHRDHEFREAWFIITVLVRATEEKQAEHEHARKQARQRGKQSGKRRGQDRQRWRDHLLDSISHERSPEEE